MTFEAIQPGLRGEVRFRVAKEHTAQHLGSGGVEVLATPQMVLLMERAGVAAVDPLLPEGFLTVGGHLDVRHLAPTPVGFEVTATAELLAVDDRRLDFRVEVHDGLELVGSGTHQRFIVDLVRFGQRVADKVSHGPGGE
ncbi:MAG: thioesterase family protein [Anaerolineae bacterium]